jgi:hypothetical protein
MEDKSGIIYKNNIIVTMFMYNITVIATQIIPTFVGPPGLLSVSWDTETNSFCYPTLEKLMSARFIVPLNILCKRLRKEFPRPPTQPNPDSMLRNFITSLFFSLS